MLKTISLFIFMSMISVVISEDCPDIKTVSNFTPTKVTPFMFEYY